MAEVIPKTSLNFLHDFAMHLTSKFVDLGDMLSARNNFVRRNGLLFSARGCFNLCVIFDLAYPLR